MLPSGRWRSTWSLGKTELPECKNDEDPCHDLLAEVDQRRPRHRLVRLVAGGTRGFQHHRVRLVGLRGPRLSRGIRRQARLLAQLHVLCRRGGGVSEATRGLQGRYRPSLLPIRAALARGRPAGTDRSEPDRELGQVEHTAARPAGLRLRGQALLGAVRVGKLGLDLSHRSGAGRRRAVAPGVRRPQICREDLDRRQCRRRLRAGLARDRAQGLDPDDRRAVPSGVRFPAQGPSERPASTGPTMPISPRPWPMARC